MEHCPICHQDFGEPEPEVIVEAEHTEKPDVEIARIQADRDIKLARISAGMAESDAVAAVAHAEGVVEGLTAAAPEEPEPEVVVVDEPEPEVEPEVEGALPEAEHHHEESLPKKSNSIFGF